MKYALIGCGRVSPNHIEAALEQNLNIVALCDIDEQKMKGRVAECGIKEARLYTDYKELVDKEQPELIAIATDSGEHAKIALYCVEHGVNVIIEKPVALSLADIDKVLEAAEKSGAKVCSCHQNRFNKSIQKIRGALEEGRYGKLFYGTIHARWLRSEDYYRQASWRGTWKEDGGALMNQSIHAIDLLRWMMGDEVDEVVAYTDQLRHNYIEAEDTGMALVKFKNGKYGIIEGTTILFPDNLEETLYMFGEKGTTKAGGKSLNQIDEWMFGDGMDEAEQVKLETKETPKNVYGNGHSSLYPDMIDAIQNGRTPYIDGYAGRRALEMVLGIYQAAATGKPVKFPLKNISTMDFQGRFGEGRK